MNEIVAFTLDAWDKYLELKPIPDIKTQIEVSGYDSQFNYYKVLIESHKSFQIFITRKRQLNFSFLVTFTHYKYYEILYYA